MVIQTIHPPKLHHTMSEVICIGNGYAVIKTSLTKEELQELLNASKSPLQPGVQFAFAKARNVLDEDRYREAMSYGSTIGRVHDLTPTLPATNYISSPKVSAPPPTQPTVRPPTQPTVQAVTYPMVQAPRTAQDVKVFVNSFLKDRSSEIAKLSTEIKTKFSECVEIKSVKNLVQLLDDYADMQDEGLLLDVANETVHQL